MEKTVKLLNVDIETFNKLLLESLNVSLGLTLEFSPSHLKSSNIVSAGTLIKTWLVETEKLLKLPVVEEDEIGVANNDNQVFLQNSLKDFTETFNFYMVGGDLLRNFLMLFKNGAVDMEFELINDNSGDYQAKSLIVNGKTDSDRPLKAKIDLTSEDFITNKVGDYNELIRHCSPKEGMCEIDLPIEQLKELRKIVNTTHKTLTQNAPYVSFAIEGDKLRCYDKVFDVTFDDLEIKTKENFVFNLLKSDFNHIGVHDFKMHTMEGTNELIFFTEYCGAKIWTLTSKPISTETIAQSIELSPEQAGEYGFINSDDFNF